MNDAILPLGVLIVWMCLCLTARSSVTHGLLSARWRHRAGRRRLSRAVATNLRSGQHHRPTATCVATLLLFSWTGYAATDLSAADPVSASFRVRIPEASGRYSSVGSGTAIAPLLVVTNNHVVSDGYGVAIVTDDAGRSVQGRVIAANPGPDLALIQVASELPYVPLGDDPQPGQTITKLGYPRGGRLQGGSVACHGVSGYRQGGVSCHVAHIITIDGDSGGGWFDDAGNLVAVTWGAANNENHATGVSHVRQMVEQAGQSVPAITFGADGVGRIDRTQAQISPIQKPTPRPPPPTAPTCPEPDYDKIARQVIIAIKGDEALQALLRGPSGPAGQAGPAGPIGLPGERGDSGEMDVASLPPLHVELVGPDGDVIESVSKRLGDTLRLNLNFKDRR